MTQEKPSLMLTKQLLAKFHQRENKESFLQAKCNQIAPVLSSPLFFSPFIYLFLNW